MERVNRILKSGIHIASFVGAGGKTSAIYEIAMQEASRGERVIITTTTHIQYPASKYWPLCEDALQAERRMKQFIDGGIAVCGIDCGVAGGIHKIKSMKEFDLERCLPGVDDSVCTLMLIESDGAKMLPLKVPIESEPVIPDKVDAVFVCAGLSALYKPLGDVCFRLKRAEDILGMEKSHIVQEGDIALLLLKGYIEPLLESYKGVNESKSVFVLLNQADYKGDNVSLFCDRRAGESIGRKIMNEARKFSNAHILRGFYITSFYKGEYYYEGY